MFSFVRPKAGVSTEEARELGMEACDHAVVAQIIGRRDGSDPGSSISFWTVDGETGKALSAAEVFQVWVDLAQAIATGPMAQTARGELAARVVRIVKNAVAAAAMEE